MGQIRLKSSAVVGLCSPLGITLRAKKKFPALRKAETMIVPLDSTRQGWDSCAVAADTFNARNKEKLWSPALSLKGVFAEPCLLQNNHNCNLGMGVC